MSVSCFRIPFPAPINYQESFGIPFVLPRLSQVLSQVAGALVYLALFEVI